MKKLLSILGISFLSLAANAQVKMPVLSPVQTIKQDFGIGSIEIKYSRPSVRGRKIFGDLLPYGQLWRTGANAATTIKFTEPVEINGTKIDTGTFALYTIPGEKTWEVIINKGTSNWGTDGYKETEDIARFKVETSRLKSPVETFTINFTDITPQSCNLQLMWEKTALNLGIVASFRDKVKSQIESAMQSSEKKPFWQAAQFYYEYEKDYPKALENVNKALEEKPEAYWMWLYKARIQNDIGDKNGALESSNRSIELAKQQKNEDYVKLNLEFQKKLK
jgi:tetratricopeptide (TPR) repeat protein